MKPFLGISDDLLASIKVLAVDVDDTITFGGKLRPSTLQSLQATSRLGVRLVLVTGRPAGWAQALAVYLPSVALAVAENGMVAFDPDGRRTDLGPTPTADFNERLAKNARALAAAYRLSPTTDDCFRLFEHTFDRPAGFDARAVADCQRVMEPGFEVLASSIHLHVRPAGFGKADGLFAALGAHAGGAVEREHILYLGDSANDRPLFAALPRTSVGVRNVEQFLDELGPDKPAYITRGEGADGLAEVVTALQAHRGRS